MNVIQWIAFFCFVVGGILAFVPNVDLRATTTLFAVGGALLALDMGNVIKAD